MRKDSRPAPTLLPRCRGPYDYAIDVRRLSPLGPFNFSATIVDVVHTTAPGQRTRIEPMIVESLGGTVDEAAAGAEAKFDEWVAQRAKP